MMAVFDEMGQASEAVVAIIANRVVPATLEFMDNFTIRAVESYSQAGLPLDAGALMLVECDGYPGQVEEDAAKVESIWGPTQSVLPKMTPNAIKCGKRAGPPCRPWPK